MTGFHPANFGLPRPFYFRVRSRHATDRQTDRHQRSIYNFSSLQGRGIIKCAKRDINVKDYKILTTSQKISKDFSH